MGTSLCQDTADVAALNLLVSQARDMLHPCPQALLSLTPLPVSQMPILHPKVLQTAAPSA